VSSSNVVPANVRLKVCAAPPLTASLPGMPPNTSDWPVLSDTLRVPSGWSLTSRPIWLARLSMAWSRASIRADGLLPVALAFAIWAFSDAIDAIVVLAESTSALRCWRTDCSWAL
jgi:hypothetical protein